MLSLSKLKLLLRPSIMSCMEGPGFRRNLFISPGEGTPTYTTTELIKNFAKIVGASQYFSPIKETEERKKLLDLLPRDVNELAPRRMKDSFQSVIIPLKNNLALRELYVNSHGSVRFGRLFEDMDIFAVIAQLPNHPTGTLRFYTANPNYAISSICYKHILNPRSEGKANPYACVTVLVDNMHVSPNIIIRPDEDIRLSGHVSSVGKSSIEISVLLDQKDQEGVWQIITESWFVFVARNALNTGGAIVNPLVGDTKEEEEFIQKGKERSMKRRLVQGESLQNKPPNQEETQIIHNLFCGSVENKGKDSTVSSKMQESIQNMSDWVLTSLFLCHPQYRNRFNKIFGGFIMRQAFEIAYATVYQFSQSKCKLVFVDDILFQKPVEIGSLLRFNASVAYVEDKYIHIPVVAEVLKPETNEKSVTNVFEFTFISLGETAPPRILPNSYLEAMRYLNARRHFNEMKASFQLEQELKNKINAVASKQSN